MDTEYTCTHCGGEFFAARNSGATLCGACAEFSDYAALARRVLHSNSGRGDTYAASDAMGYPSSGGDGDMTYHVHELGGSIPTMYLCGAHDALYRWDAVSAECGVAHDDAGATYTTMGAEGHCTSCNEWGSIERRPVSDAHCDTCTC